MSFANVAAKVVSGFAGAAGNSDAQNEVSDWQAQRQAQRGQQLKLALAPLSQVMQADQQRLTSYSDPMGNPLPGYEHQHTDIMKRMTDTIGQMRGILGQPPPPQDESVLDKLHITNHIASHTPEGRKAALDAYNAQSQNMAQNTAAAALPFGMSAPGQELAAKTAGDIAVAKARAAATPQLTNFLKPDGSMVTINTKSQVPDPAWTKMGVISSVDAGKKTDFENDPNKLPGETREQWTARQTATGRAAGTPVKPLTPSATYMNLTAKKLLADRGQGPVLTNEENAQREASEGALTVAGIARMREMATLAAQYNMQAVTDPDTGMEVLVTRAQASSAARSGTPFLAGAVGAPTGMDKKNQMLAHSAIMQVNRMQQILKDDPNLTGPGAGQLTQLQTFLGTQDPDAQQFMLSSLLGSEHGVAVFGGRNVHTINDLNNVIGNMKTNPAALTGALDVIKETMSPWLTAGGRLPGPEGPTRQKNNAAKAASGSWTPPADAPPAPKADGKLLKANGQVIAKSHGGQWVKP